MQIEHISVAYANDTIESVAKHSSRLQPIARPRHTRDEGSVSPMLWLSIIEY